MNNQETFQGILDYWAEIAPDREAIFDGQQRRTFRELKEEVQCLAFALSQLEIRKGDKVLTIIPNWYEFIVIFFALAKLGAILVPCNEIFAKNEICDRLQQVEPKAVFIAHKSHFCLLQEQKLACEIITTRFEEKDLLSFAKLLEKGRNGAIRPVEVDSYSDVFTIMLTSGSTGRPKGVELTYENLFQGAKSIGERLECTHQDIFLVPVPCSHLYGLVTGIVLPLYFGGKIVLMENYSPQEALSLIEQEKVTVHYGVPTMFIREINEHLQHKKDVSSLRTGMIGGTMVDEHLVRQIRSVLNCNIMVAYGSTEAVTVSMTTLQDDLELRTQTAGRPYEGVEVKVIDGDGKALGLGEVGELICKGFNVMKGYHLAPEETAKIIDENGWLHTGDLGTIDRSGYIRIVGRKKDTIIRGGYNIYPGEVEKVYYTHPEVLEVCVMGVMQEELGEQIYAFIQLKKDSEETETTLREYTRDKIAKFKIPDQVILIKEMPRSPNGKIDKKALAKGRQVIRRYNEEI